MTTVDHAPVPLATQLSTLLRAAVSDWESNRPRSRQSAIGPSDLGHPCDRYLAYRALGRPQLASRGDTWLPTVGTACHDYVFAPALSAPGVGVETGGRWLVEVELDIAPGVKGHGDAFDTHTGTVVDHKVLGTASLRDLRLRGAKPQYRVQIHVYGFGYRNLGYDVRNVAIAGWPRSSFLDGTNGFHLWHEPYDEEVVEQALQRWFRIVEAAPGLDANPILFTILPTADGPCSWCPFRNAVLAATNPERACPGHPGSSADKAAERFADGLVA